MTRRTKSLRAQAQAELKRMKRKPQRQTNLKLYEVDRWNPSSERWEDVVILARSESEARRRVRMTHIKRVEDFV